MDPKLRIGDKVRPWGGINFGTLGFFCTDNREVLHFATCDHVIKTLATAEHGPQKMYFPLGSSYPNKVGIFEGRSLATHDAQVADIGIVRVEVAVESSTALPASVASTKIDQIRKAVSPSKGAEVLLWGARTAEYHSGVVLETQSSHSWPHGKYGLVKYEKQFSVAIPSHFTPEVGDSGGYVITPDGNIIGIIAALSGTVSDAGNSIIHCVPIKECCELLGVMPITFNSGD